MKNQILVLGIGNTIRGDDGIGIHLVRKLKQILPQKYQIKELSTAGLDLMDAISGFSEVILIDAIQTPEGEPGQIYHLSLEDFKSSSNLSSTHALDLKQILELGKRLMGKKMPDKIEILAVEAPQVNEFKETLSPELEGQFDIIVDKVRREIEK